MARPKSEDKKQALLEAATQAIAQSGIAASTAVIARNAGVAEGTLFRYFATKDELINTLYLHLKQDLCQSMIMELDRSITDAKMMTRFIWNSEAADILTTCAQLWIMTYALLSLFSLLDVIFNLSQKWPAASQLPLKGIFQGIKLIGAIIVGILMISLLIGQSPAILISGLGAMAAVLMLVFKDPILGLVAGIQLSANDMLKLGDWLEMPKYGADGAVIDIGLTTVKVRNWDNTITTIPTWSLVSDSFKNWSGMSASGGRRIKRSINIDATSIHFLDDDEKQRLLTAQLLKPYLTSRHQEIDEWNKQLDAPESALNHRRMTNIGTFRAYLNEYLRHHPRIRKDMTLMVRQLAPDDHGLPIEIYAFTNTVVWLEYESIQADIFDHIFAVVEEFGLRIHQTPTGSDIRALSGTLRH